MNRMAVWASRLLPWLLGLAIASVPFYKGLFNVAMVAYALVWLVSIPALPRSAWTRLRTQPALWWLLGLMAWVGVGLMYGEASGEALARPAIFMLRMAIVTMAALALHVDHCRRWLDVFVVAQTLVLLAVYAQHFGISGYATHIAITDRISQNLMQSFLVAIALWRCRFAPAMTPRLLWLVLALLAAYGILMLSDGRTGYLALFAVLLVFAVWRRRWWSLPAGAIGIAILALAAYSFSPSFHDRVDQVLQDIQMQGAHAEQTSTGARVAMWSFGAELVAQRPILGVGSGGYPAQARAHFTDPYTCSIVCFHTHNQFLFFAVENGLIGLAIYLGLLGALWRNARANPNRVAGGIAASYLVILAVDSMTHGPFWIAREFYFFSSWLPMMLLSFSTPTEGSHA